MMRRFREFWTRLWKPKTIPPPELPEGGEFLNDRDPFEIQIEQYSKGLSDGSDGTHGVSPAQYRSRLWRLAWTDGRLSHPFAELMGALRYQANLEIEEIIRGLREKVASEEAATEQLKQHAETAGEQAASHRTRLNVLQEQQIRNPTEFSLWFAFVYLSIALFITVSDVPLSLNLVATGFGLPNEVRLVQQAGEWVRQDPMDAQFQQPSVLVVQVSDLFEHFWLVVKYLWEPWALAIGIAACGFLFKLFLGYLSAFASKSQIGSGSSSPPNWQSWLLPVVYGVLLLVVVYTYFRLADLRGNEHQIASLDKQLANLREEQARVPAGQEQAVQSQIDSTMTKLNDAYSARARLSPQSFFWLTVTLPFVAGAFLAAGSDCVSRRSKLRLLERIVKQLEDNSMQLSEQAIKQHRAVETRRKFVEQVVQSGEYRKQFIESRLAIYRHGYRRGLRVPETSHPSIGTYAWCEKALLRKLGGNLRLTAVKPAKS